MIASLLARWSAKRPEECWQTDKGAWAIGDYTFVVSSDTGVLSAYHEQTGNRWVTGQPALDWLRGAIMRVMKEQGIYNVISYWPPRNKFKAEVENKASIDDDPTIALLISYVKYLEGQSHDYGDIGGYRC